MIRYFCTYFDSNYVSRAVALYNSLLHCGVDFRLFALCMNEQAEDALERLALKRLITIPLTELEASNSALRSTKATRSRVEYYYTCGPSALLYVMERFPQVDLLTYLDADLYFFSSPEPIFDEIQSKSVGIIEHRFPASRQSLNRFGKYNVGWISFRADPVGKSCLRWWADRCIEWCFDRIEGERFADQKYLDQFDNRFPGVHTIEHPGANVAPWNLARHVISQSDQCILVDGKPLIFFHFHGFKMLKPWLGDTNMGEYRGRPTRLIKEKIFVPYMCELLRLQSDASPTASLMDASRAQSRGYGLVMNSVRHTVRVALAVMRNAYVVNWNAVTS